VAKSVAKSVAIEGVEQVVIGGLPGIKLVRVGNRVTRCTQWYGPTTVPTQTEFEVIERAKFCGRLNKKVCDSDFFRALLSAKKVVGVTRRDDVSLLWQPPSHP